MAKTRRDKTPAAAPPPAPVPITVVEAKPLVEAPYAAPESAATFDAAPAATVTLNPPTVSTVPTLRTALNWLTLEVLFYAVLIIVAVLLRVANLAARPLSPQEAQTAAAAWAFLNGLPVGNFTSPFLFTLDWLSFLLLGASDLSARLLPALLGSSLVLLPLLARRELGRTGTLAASVMIALSPTLVWSARSVIPVDLAVGGALAAVILFWRYAESQNPQPLYWGAVFAALALTTGPAAYTILVPGLVFIVGTRLIARRRAEPAPESQEPSESSTAASTLRSPFARAIALFAVFYILSATTFLLNRDGLGVAFNLFGQWLSDLSSFGPLTTPLNILLVYEPLTLIFGIAGVVLSFMLRANETPARVGLWLLSAVALFSLLWYSIAGVKQPSDAVAVGMPLMLLAGWFVGTLLERAVQDIRSAGGWSSMSVGEIPVAIMLFVLAALIYLQIVTFLQQTQFSQGLAALYTWFSGNAQEPSLTSAAAVLSIITLSLLAVFIALSILLIGAARTTTLVALVILALLSLGTLRALWLLNFSTDEPQRDLLTLEQTPLQIRDLVSDLEFQSQWRYGDGHVIKLVADEALGPVGHWYLRAFPHLVWTSNPASLQDAQAIVTPAETPPPGNWEGQRYRFASGWTPDNLVGIDLWKWLLFRSGGADSWSTTMLWIPTNLQPPPQ